MKRKRRKNILKNVLLLVLVFGVVFYRYDISRFIVKKIVYRNARKTEIHQNDYSLRKDYQFVQITDDFVAKDYQHLLNIFYTILDSGEESFSFYCDDSYADCEKDVYQLLEESEQSNPLADLNNFVHPYNTYSFINATSNSFGKVTLTIEKQYPPEKIEEVQKQIANIREEIKEDELSTVEKIKAFHDYIVNYSVYDIERATHMNEEQFKDSTTHTAYGLLETKKALCGGYSDLMSIYLFSLNIPNIRISADDHVWNLVQLEDGWKHLDVTWDDPVTNTGQDLLIHDYFLISYDQLMELDNVVHLFNQDVYQEAK